MFFYAMKANSNMSVLRLFASAGLGVDTVSIGEIKKAMLAGVPARGSFIRELAIQTKIYVRLWPWGFTN